MKKIIKKLTILCLTLGVVLNLVQVNIHTFDSLRNIQETKNLAKDELVYPDPQVLANPINIRL